MTLTLRIGSAKPVPTGGIQTLYILEMEAVVVSDSYGPGHSNIFIHRRGGPEVPDQFQDVATAIQLSHFPRATDGLKPGDLYLRSKASLALLSAEEFTDVRQSLLSRAKVLVNEWNLMTTGLLNPQDVAVTADLDVTSPAASASPAIGVFNADNSKVQFVDATGRVIGEVNLMQAP
jgi:hypothetical protein